ncbi:MAG: alpha/beta fold hydrolase [Cyanophyceae cyanobacterium]
MVTIRHWQERIGRQRDWVWRGWQTRYTYMPLGSLASSPDSRMAVAPEQSCGPTAPPLPQDHPPPLILLHGFGASIEQWRHNVPVLSQHHAVYALDLLGFGGSKKAPVSYGVHLWVQQVYDFWQTFIRRPVVLVGNSIGSLVCMTTAAAHPEMVQALVLLNLPDVGGAREQFPRWLQTVESMVKGAIASPPLLRTVFKIVRRPPFVRRWAGLAYADRTAITDELVNILAAPAQDEGAARAFCALFRAIGEPHFAPAAKVLLPTLEIPILLIWGRYDRMVPASLAQTFAALNPNIQVVELEAGHCPHDECPDRVNQILVSWLKAPQVQGTGETIPPGRGKGK